MPLGAANPLPFRIGPGPTRTQQIHAALRSAHGLQADGTSAAGPEDGLRDLWTWCVARQIARRGGTSERAIYQVWPASMTSSLDTWETLLGLPRAASLPARQEAVRSAIAAKYDATVPGLRAALVAIDPNLDILATPWERSIATEPGRSFQQLPGTGGAPFWGAGPLAQLGRIGTGFPMLSTGSTVLVVYIANTVPPPKVAQAVRKLLNDALPSYVDFFFVAINPGSGGAGPSGAGMFFDGAHGAVMDWSAMF